MLFPQSCQNGISKKPQLKLLSLLYLSPAVPPLYCLECSAQPHLPHNDCHLASSCSSGLPPRRGCQTGPGLLQVFPALPTTHQLLLELAFVLCLPPFSLLQSFPRAVSFLKCCFFLPVPPSLAYGVWYTEVLNKC